MIMERAVNSVLITVICAYNIRFSREFFRKSDLISIGLLFSSVR